MYGIYKCYNGYARTHCIPVEMYCRLLLGSLDEKKAFKRKGGCRGEMIEGGRQGAWKGTSNIQCFLLSDFTPGHLHCAFMTVILHDPASCVCRVAVLYCSLGKRECV